MSTLKKFVSLVDAANKILEHVDEELSSNDLLLCGPNIVALIPKVSARAYYHASNV